MEIEAAACRLRTDPTYKEWKPEFDLFNVNDWDGTDPTYKEWKQSYQRYVNRLAEVGTDPTYKEWKRVREIDETGAIASTDPTYKEWKPPRPLRQRQPPPKHGSYLQGMETR